MKKIRNFPQISDWDCGVSVVQTTLYHLCDKRYSHRKIAKALNAKTEYGTNFWQIEDGIKKLNKSLHVETHTMTTISSLITWNNDDTILIIDWWDMTNGHYSIITDITEEFIVLVDPQYYKTRTLEMSMFSSNWFDWEGVYEHKNWVDRGVIKVTKKL